MENETPSYLTCPWCNAQAYRSVHLTLGDVSLRKYVCPAQHVSFILAEDTNFNYGFNKENSCE